MALEKKQKRKKQTKEVVSKKKKGTPKKSTSSLSNEKTHAQKLAERVKALHNPTAAFDPEDEDFFGESARIDTSSNLMDDESSDGETHVLKSHLRSGIDLDELGEQYKGKVVARKSLYDDDEEDEQDMDIDDDEDGEEEEMSDGDLKDKLEMMMDEMEFDDQGSSSEGEEEEGEDDDDRNIIIPKGHDSSILSREQKLLRAELDKLEDEEETEIFRKQAVEDDVEKAKQVKNQHFLSENTMDLRIRLQGPLLAANRMPVEADRKLFIEKSKSIKKAYKKASKSTSALLLDLLELQSEMMKNNKILGKHSSYKPKFKKSKRNEEEEAEEEEEGEGEAASKKKIGILDLDDCWKYIEKVQKRMEPQYKDVIDQWNRKTQLSSGAQNVTSKQFKSINQSIVSQIHSLWADEEELVKRSQLNRSALSVFGKRKRGEDGEDIGGKSVASILQGSKEVLNTNIYDDSDFYQVLLKDIISSGYDHMVDADDGILNELRAAKMKKKKSSKVDRRASKGRKIRYVPIPPLVNFMMPIVRHDEDFVVDELYATLFGRVPTQPVRRKGEEEEEADSDGDAKDSADQDDGNANENYDMDFY